MNKDLIIKRQYELLKKDKSGKGYVCPLCGSGTGPKGTGMSTKDGVHFTCFSCGQIHNNDIFDIIGLQYGLKSYQDKIKKCCEMLKIPFDPKPATPTPIVFDDIDTPRTADDFTEFYALAAAHLSDTSYRRGLSDSTLKKYNIGYDSSWVNPQRPDSKESKRLIIPITDTCYFARSTDSDGEYSKISVGGKEFFNIGAVESAAEPVFIVEGEIDALSIIDAGFQAVALSGISNAQRLIDTLGIMHPDIPFIIALDNEPDKPKVKSAADKLKNGLEKIGLTAVISQPYGEFKDANEALCNDRESFKIRLSRAQKEAAEYNPTSQYLASGAAGRLLERFEGGEDTAPCISTTFSAVDAALDGGLYEGLYTVGAISSLGKTTFCLNIADAVAANGTDVLFFSVEMGAEELVAKSLSRITLECGISPKTTRDVLSRTKSLSKDGKTALIDAAQTYSENIGSHLYIIEGVGTTGVKSIRDTAEKHIRATRKPCVVFVDYLQILEPYDERATDKQNVDKNVKLLKIMSRELHIPVVVISSFNRESYETPVTLASFKESGAIEYSADCLIGLQYHGMDYEPNEKKEARNARVQTLLKHNAQRAKDGESLKIDLKVLKERHGCKGTALLEFCPKYNRFSVPKEISPISFDDEICIDDPDDE